MDSDYFSADAILAEEDRVPVVFKVKAATLGFLDPGCMDEDLPEKSRVDIPLWLAKALEAKSMVKIELPKHYSARFREDLLAGPESVDIRERSNFFYETGNQLARVKKDEHLQRTMRMAFSGQRFRGILDASLNSGGDDMTDFLTDLPHSERKLFKAGYEGSSEYSGYKQGKHDHIGLAKVLKNQTVATTTTTTGGGAGGGGGGAASGRHPA